MPSSPSPDTLVSVRVVRGLLHTIEQAGVSQLKLLHAVQLDPKQLTGTEARLPRRLVYRACELAVELTADPAFGLHWGERLGASAFPPISHLIEQASTLRQAFETLARYRSLLSDHLGYELIEREGRVTVCCVSLAAESLVTQRFIAEMIVVGMSRLVRLFNPRGTFERVGFTYPAPEYGAEYERVFGGPVSFEQPFSGIVFDSALMSAASPYQDEELREALRSIAERRVLQLSGSTPYALRARDLLVQQNAPHQLDMAGVARSLGLSERSLRRRLVEEGTSYDATANEACCLVVKRLLLDRRCTIQEAAYEMGFASTTAFHRAFKRWTGMTPNAFRAHHLGAGERR